MSTEVHRNNDALVVGGYGEVGRCIVAELTRRWPGHVVVAGRNEAKARAMAARWNGRVQTRHLDLSAPASFAAALAGIGVVVVCVEQQETDFVDACLQGGIHYVDVSASYAFLRRVEALQPLARAHGATCVLSVGLAPGVTNLLARRVVDALERTEHVDIDILLGLGDVHGPAAIEWMLANAHRKYSIGEGPHARVVTPFREPRRVELPAPFCRRTTYAFDFADQHALARTLAIPSAQTRLCFDSALVTLTLASLAALRALRLLRWRRLRQLMARLLGWAPFGSSAFVTRVSATGTSNGRRTEASAFVRGDGEARATGVVAAFVAEQLLEGQPPGVWHIDQLVDVENALTRLADRGFVVSPTAVTALPS